MKTRVGGAEEGDWESWKCEVERILLRRRRSDKNDNAIGMGNVTGRSVLAEYRARNHKLPRGM